MMPLWLIRWIAIVAATAGFLCALVIIQVEDVATQLKAVICLFLCAWLCIYAWGMHAEERKRRNDIGESP